MWTSFESLYKWKMEENAILERWTEHFNRVLNRPSSVNDNAINGLPQLECNVLLDDIDKESNSTSVFW